MPAVLKNSVIPVGSFTVPAGMVGESFIDNPAPSPFQLVTQAQFNLDVGGESVPTGSMPGYCVD